MSIGGVTNGLFVVLFIIYNYINTNILYYSIPPLHAHSQPLLSATGWFKLIWFRFFKEKSSGTVEIA